MLFTAVQALNEQHMTSATQSNVQHNTLRSTTIDIQLSCETHTVKGSVKNFQ